MTKEKQVTPSSVVCLRLVYLLDSRADGRILYNSCQALKLPVFHDGEIAITYAYVYVTHDEDLYTADGFGIL
jgi:hypothetical protein